MAGVRGRLLNPSVIPITLWNSTSNKLSLPESLNTAYRTLIARHSLQTLADARNANDPPVGGLDKARTDQHFAQAFDGSAARALLALLDPLDEVAAASNAFMQILSGGSVCVVDAPSGAGATVLAFLSGIGELRARSVLPREPIDVSIVAAEISDPARMYAQEMFAELENALADQAIFVQLILVPWDVTDLLSNTDLIRRITQESVTHPKLLVVVANFNSFLEREGKKKDAQPQLEELFRHMSGKNNMGLWIEPDMNRATGQGGLFEWLRKLFETGWKRFVSSESGIQKSSAMFSPSLRPQTAVRVTLAVLAMLLVRKK